MPAEFASMTSEIQLDHRNMCTFVFPTKETLPALIDTGSTRTLISEKLVQQSLYLSSLPVVTLTEPIQFMVGNGEKCISVSYIEPDVYLSDTLLTVRLFIVQQLSNFAIIVGNDTHKKYKCTIDLAKNILKIRRKVVPVSLLRTVYLKPGETKLVKVISPLPWKCRDQNFIVTLRRKYQKLSAVDGLYCFKHGRTALLVRNPYQNAIVLASGTIVGHITPRDCLAKMENFESGMEKAFPIVDLGPESVPKINCESVDQSSMTQDELFYYKKSLYPYLKDDDKRLITPDCDLIKQQIKLNDSKLSLQGKEQLYNILEKNKNALALHDNIGKVHRYQVRLQPDFPDPHEGFSSKPYIHSPRDKEFAIAEVDKLIQMGVFQKGLSTHTSSLFLVRRSPQHAPRLVADLRRTNQMFRNVNKSTHTIKSFCEMFGRNRNTYVTVLDLKSAYYSLKLTEDSKQYVGVNVCQNYPAITFSSLPMGHKQSCSLFNQIVHYILQELPSDVYKNRVLSYFDDLLLFDTNEKDHLETIDLVLSVLAKHGLTISLTKAQIAPLKGVQFLGYFIDLQAPKGPKLTVLKSRVQDIDKLRPPQSKKDVKRVLGMLQYVSQFIPDYQKLAVPLTELLRKRKDFVWTDEHDTAWNAIKKRLKEAPALSFPSMKEEDYFIVETDCSRKAMGAVLRQVQTDEDGSRSEHLIAYFSKNLSRLSTLTYSVLELEMTALYSCLVAFQTLLVGRYFLVRTDHKALEYVMKNINAPPTLRVQRLLWKLSSFQFQIKYVKPGEVTMADFLSRHPSDDTEDYNSIVPIGINDKELLESFPADSVTLDHSLVVTRSQTRAQTAKTDRQISSQSQGRVQGQCQLAKNGMSEHVDQKVPVATSVNKVVDTVSARTRQAKFSVKNEGKVAKMNESTRSLVDFGGPNLSVMGQNQINQDVKGVPVNETPLALPRPTMRNVVNDPQSSKNENALSEPRINEVDKTLVTNETLFSKGNPRPILLSKMPSQKDIEQGLKDTIFDKFKEVKLPYTKSEIAIAQKNDVYFGPIYKYLKHGTLPRDNSKARSIIALAEHYILADDILFYLRICDRKTDDVEPSLALPNDFILPVLNHYHVSHRGFHMKTSKLYLSLKALFHAPNFYSHVLNFVRTCMTCNQIALERDASLNREWTPRTVEQFSPFHRVFMDFKVMPKTIDDYRYVLVMVCEVTRFCIAVPMKTRTAQETAEAIVSGLCLPYRTPKVIVCDQDTSFKNHLMEFLARLLHVNLHYVQVMGHESSKAERFVGVISNLLVSKLGHNYEIWPKALPYVCKAYNSSKVIGLNYSPHYLVFLHEDRSLLDAAERPFEQYCSSKDEYIALMKDRFKIVSDIVQERHNAAQQLQCISHEVKHGHKFKQLKKGDLVYLLCPTSTALYKSEKLKFNYVGILYIYDIVNQNEYILSTVKNEILVGSYHLNRLKKGSIALPNGQNVHTIEELRKAMTESEERKIPSDVNLQSAKPLPLAYFISEDKRSLEEIQTSQNGSNNAEHSCIFVEHVDPDEKGQVTKPYYAKVDRIRWAKGMPQMLCYVSKGKNKVPFSFWVTIEQHPVLCGRIAELLTLPVRQIGSFDKFMKEIYY